MEKPISIDDLRQELSRFAETSIRSQLSELTTAIQSSYRTDLHQALGAWKLRDTAASGGGKKPPSTNNTPRVKGNPTETAANGVPGSSAEHKDTLKLPGQPAESHAIQVPPSPIPLHVIDAEEEGPASRPSQRALLHNGSYEADWTPTASSPLSHPQAAADSKKKVLHLTESLKKLRTQCLNNETALMADEMDEVAHTETRRNISSRAVIPEEVEEEELILEAEARGKAEGFARMSSSADDVGGKVKTTAAAMLKQRGNTGGGIKHIVENHLYRNNNVVERAVKSSMFEYGVSFLVLFNAIWIGVTTDMHAGSGTASPSTAENVIDKIFFALFATELTFRLYVYQWWFFRTDTPLGVKNQQLVWNILDTFIVVFQALDAIILLADIGDANFLSKFGVLRILRLLRIIRIVRVGKLLKFVRSMHTILMSISQCIGLFFWSVMCLFIFTYIVAVYFTEAVSSTRISYAKDGTPTPNDADLELYFGSVGDSWLSLLKAVTGGIDWGDLTTALFDLNFVWGVLPFLIYLLFSLLAIMNVITGIFLETATDRAKQEKEVWLLRNARSVFMAADHTKDGTITWDDFSSTLMRPDMHQFFEAIDLDIQQAEILFELLDSSGDGNISSDEFLRGCLRLRGSAKALDLLILSREVTQLIEWTVDTINDASEQNRNFQDLVEANKNAIHDNHEEIAEIKALISTLKTPGAIKTA